VVRDRHTRQQISSSVFPKSWRDGYHTELDDRPQAAGGRKRSDMSDTWRLINQSLPQCLWTALAAGE
jgi:hypothetical protein